MNGAQTKDLEAQLDSRSVQTLIAESNVVIISIGGNDLWGGAEGLRRSPQKNAEKVMGATLDSLDRIVKKVRTANPRARIFIVGLYNPFVSAPFGNLLSVLVSKWNSLEFDRFADGYERHDCPDLRPLLAPRAPLARQLPPERRGIRPDRTPDRGVAVRR